MMVYAVIGENNQIIEIFATEDLAKESIAMTGGTESLWVEHRNVLEQATHL